MVMIGRKVIKVELPEGWSDCSHDNPEGPPTFIRDISNIPGVFQVSLTLYKDGEIPNPSSEELIDLATRTGKSMPAGDLVETSSGKCKFGKFGTAIFQSIDFPLTQIWYLSDGLNFILATHIFSGSPEAGEVEEGQRIVDTISISKKSFWKFFSLF